MNDLLFEKFKKKKKRKERKKENFCFWERLLTQSIISFVTRLRSSSNSSKSSSVLKSRSRSRYERMNEKKNENKRNKMYHQENYDDEMEVSMWESWLVIF